MNFLSKMPLGRENSPQIRRKYFVSKITKEHHQINNKETTQ